MTPTALDHIARIKHQAKLVHDSMELVVDILVAPAKEDRLFDRPIHPCLGVSQKFNPVTEEQDVEQPSHSETTVVGVLHLVVGLHIKRY